jgi:glyoxylase-like metal-dependent hydrolase (beta-lactamase superfamily II)
MSIRTVAEGVISISLAWSNAYLLQEGSDTALIDTGLYQDRERLMAALKQLGLQVGQLGAVYLTHAHCDHAGNAAHLAAQGARLYAHRAEASFIGLPRRSYACAGSHMLLRPLSMLAFLIGEHVYPVARRNADVLLQDGDTVDAPGGALRVIACPGHTPGHIAYYRERDGVLFSGDAILNIIPLRRLTALSLPIRVFSDNWPQTIRSAQRLAQLRPQTLLAGHGWPLNEDAAGRISAWADALG